MKKTNKSIGDKIGKITIVNITPHYRGKGFSCEWVCECGTNGKNPMTWVLARKSCGCSLGYTRFTHRQSAASGDTYEYHLWSMIKARCHNQNASNYKWYGARGIKVYEVWRNDFVSFANYIITELGTKPSAEHTLDRIDPTKDYEPGNLRWATNKQQHRNTRNNKMLTIRGVTMCVGEWSELSGTPYSKIANRIISGWNAEDAVYGEQIGKRKWKKAYSPVENGSHAVDPPHHLLAKNQPRIQCTSGMKPAI